jgi:hypothetical protein
VASRLLAFLLRRCYAKTVCLLGKPNGALRCARSGRCATSTYSASFSYLSPAATKTKKSRAVRGKGSCCYAAADLFNELPIGFLGGFGGAPPQAATRGGAQNTRGRQRRSVTPARRAARSRSHRLEKVDARFEPRTRFPRSLKVN